MDVPPKRELAYYYPNPMWQNGDWIKNLILFFDGIALLVPDYIKDKPEATDPAIVAGLKQHNLLEIISPEVAVDKASTERLATAMTEIITSGVLDHLAKEDTAFHELSRSRMGYYGDHELAEMIFEELRTRKLAKDSGNNITISMHPMVRALVLVLLSQILRPYGNKINAELSPITDRGNLVQALAEILGNSAGPSVGSVIEFDLNAVTVDVSAFPIDEVLDFRSQNLQAYRRYSLSVKKFAMELSRMPDEERKIAFDLRQAELNDVASDLRGRSRKAWKKPSSFALTLVGSALSAASGGVAAVGGALRALTAMVGYEESKPSAGAYSYLFSAAGRFRG
jgi:hypothetical protein